jgi:hypothetical protein
MPKDQLFSDMRYDGLPLNERMADMHFARQGRKFRRRNSLSIDKPIGKLRQTLKGQRKPSNQHLSPLFAKLPYEIRIEIFKQVLLDTTGAVFIHTIPFTNDYESFHTLRIKACEPDLGTPPSLDDLDRVGPGVLNMPGLDTVLLRTCRAVYSEALPLLYSQIQFIFRNPRHLIAFSHTIPRAHLEHIRSVRLDFSKLSSVYVREYRRSIITFKTPLLQPMQESFRIIRLMRQLRSCYILFRISSDYLWIDPEVGVILKDLQEYYERIRGATYTQCKVHLLVYENFVGMELVHQNTERGLLEMEKDDIILG